MLVAFLDLSDFTVWIYIYSSYIVDKISEKLHPVVPFFFFSK